ncbi:hypothetical protein [Algoriphagus pacificus]|uniref:DUF922 domain-containing protein n=1 Tax=Algoriphagus pacificus TaxID=2811234 RepID=A0ABS3CGU2_9BACT|nr:hypothetical protein [Algoriphagus pacificus]MBN7816312.1 hypothetical protein [Algoriphagus pacificus]
MKISFYLKFLVLCCFLLCSFKAVSQEVKIKLRPHSRSQYQVDYHFGEILDLRKNKELIGEVFYVTKKRIPVSFEEELDPALLDYFNSQIDTASEDNRKIQVRILDLSIYESPNYATKLYEGELKLRLAFYFKGNLNPIHLVTYSNLVKYQRTANSINKLQEVTNEYLDQSLAYFNQWMDMNAGTNRDLAKSVRMNARYILPDIQNDTIFYNPNIPLNWEYFKDRPDPLSKFNATITCSFSVEGNAQLNDGIIQQNIFIKAFMLPNQSWVKNPDDYGINHEQKHFDLLKVIVDRLIYRLNNTELELEFFEAKINEMYFDAYREMNRIQELYDTQTQNGMDAEQQQKWNFLIVKALKGEWEDLEKELGN